MLVKSACTILPLNLYYLEISLIGEYFGCLFIVTQPFPKSYIWEELDKKKQLVSSLGEGIDDFERRLRYHFHETGTLKSQEIAAVSDGALWIEKMIERNIPKAVHILDWFHVTEHLWDTAKKFFGEKSEKSKPWVSKYKHL